MATFRKRGNTYQAAVCVNGIRKTATHDTKEAAQKWARQMEAALDSGTYVDLSEAAQTTLQSLIKRFATEQVIGQRRTPAAAQREIYLLNRLAARPLAQKTMAKLTASDFAQYRTDRLQEVSPATVRNELIEFSLVIKTAINEWGLQLPGNPAESSKVKRPKVSNKRDRVLDHAEYERLGNALRQCQNPLVHPAALFSYETGLRMSELLGVTWRDVNFEEQTVHVNKVLDSTTKKIVWKTKNGDIRYVCLSTQAIKILRELLRTDSSVFPVTHDTLDSAFEHARERAKVVDFHWHDLRHCAITKMARYIPNPMDLMTVSGHKNVEQVVRYYTAQRASALAKLLP